MDKYVDLSDEKFQGKFCHDMVDNLQKPGDYILRFFSKKEPLVKSRKCHVYEISYARNGAVQMIRTGKRIWYYYNGVNKCFKPTYCNPKTF